MNKFSGLGLLLLVGTASAQSMLETTDEVGKRQDAQRYEQWREHKDKPLGGYSDSLGQPYRGSGYRDPGQAGHEYQSPWADRAKEKRW